MNSPEILERFCHLLIRHVGVDGVSIASIQNACEVSLERVEQPLYGQSDIIKDSCLLVNKQGKTC